MLREQKPDFVDIATTVASHRALVELAAAEKIPAIVQKPFGPIHGRLRGHGRGLRRRARAPDGARELPLPAALAHDPRADRARA